MTFRRLLLLAAPLALCAVAPAVGGFGPARIVEVRQRLQMTPEERPVRDYYIDAGSERGLRPGALVDVVREVAVHGATPDARLVLPVGVMRIIHADMALAVGRLCTLSESADHPVLVPEAFMVGDQLDLGTVRDSDPPTDERAEQSVTTSPPHLGPSDDGQASRPDPPVASPGGD